MVKECLHQTPLVVTQRETPRELRGETSTLDSEDIARRLILTSDPQFTHSLREPGPVIEKISNDVLTQGHIELLELKDRSVRALCRLSVGASSRCNTLRNFQNTYANHRPQLEGKDTSGASSQQRSFRFPQTLRQDTKTMRQKRRFLTRRTINGNSQAAR